MNKILTKKPRALIIIASQDIGGPGKGIFQFIENAAREEFEYILCNFNFRNRTIGQFVDEASKKKLNLILLNQHFTIDPMLLLQARNIILKNNINIIQTHGYKPGVIGFFMSKLYRIPWIGFAHGYIEVGKKLRLYNRLDKIILKYADRVVAVSESMKRLLKEAGVKENKIKVIYNAIDETNARPTASAESIRVCYGIKNVHKVIGVVGRLSPEKGQVIFLKAFKRLVNVYPDIRAFIVGDGPDKKMLEEYCEVNGLKDKVIFTGYQEDVANFYQIFDIMVLPSFTEGLPNAVLEAMLFGVSVIATSVGGVPEIINNSNGIIVPPDKQDVLADKMIELLKNDELRKSLGQKGKESLYPKFSPSRRAGQIIDLYKELLDIK
jgi:glycosyltransferase involved in cell wall biosynthesis